MTAKSIVLAVLCVSLAGCGAALSKAPTPGDAASTSDYRLNNSNGSDAGHHQRGGQGHERAHGHDGGMGGLLGGKAIAQLGLTDDQKASLKAIAAKYRPAPGTQPDPTARKAEREKVQALLKADPLDTAAVKALIEQHRTDAAARVAKRVDMLAEMREVLTADQREKLAGLIEARAAKAGQHQGKPGQPDGKGGHGGWGQHPGAGQANANAPKPAALTDDQKAKLKALMAKRHGEPGARAKAMAAFVRTGDKAALAAALAAPDASDEAVAFLASLSADQRTRFGGFILGGGPGFGGPHGRFGRGGHERGGHHPWPKPSASPAS